MNPKTLLRLVVVATCFVISTGQFCPAQQTSQAQNQFLFRGRPLPICRSFFIYEAGLLGRINSPSGFEFDRGSKLAGTLDVGLMWNRSPTHAIGGLGHLSIDGGGARVSALVRYRRWLAEMPSGSGARPLRVDIDAGLVVVKFDESIYNQKWLNVSTGIGLNIEDLVILTMRYETYRTSEYTYRDYGSYPYVDKTMPPQTNGTFYFGIKGGSYVGAASSIIVGGVVAVLLIAYSSYQS